MILTYIIAIGLVQYLFDNKTTIVLTVKLPLK